MGLKLADKQEVLEKIQGNLKRIGNLASSLTQLNGNFKDFILSLSTTLQALNLGAEGLLGGQKERGGIIKGILNRATRLKQSLGEITSSLNENVSDSLKIVSKRVDNQD